MESPDKDKVKYLGPEWVSQLESLGESKEEAGMAAPQVLVVDHRPKTPQQAFPDHLEVPWRDRTTKRKWLLVVLLGIIVGLLYVVLLKCSVDEVKLRTVDSETFKAGNDIKERSGRGAIALEIRILSVSLEDNQIKTHITFLPSSQIARLHGRLSTSVYAYLGYYQREFSVNSTMSPIEVTYPTLSGSISYYPFDRFYTTIDVEFTDLSQNLVIPTVVKVQASIPSLQFDIAHYPRLNLNEETQTDTAPGLSFQLVVTRPITVKIFSLLVLGMMWILTVVLIGVTFNVIFLSNLRPTASYLGIGTSLLFALPNLRQTQPGVPPIGIISDAIGFIWNMTIISICTVAMIIIWIKRRHTESTIE